MGKGPFEGPTFHTLLIGTSQNVTQIFYYSVSARFALWLGGAMSLTDLSQTALLAVNILYLQLDNHQFASLSHLLDQILAIKPAQ